MNTESNQWPEYYRYVKGIGPSNTLLKALDLFDREGVEKVFAVDIGCGEGRDTVELLKRGWRVLAVDREPTAIAALLSRVSSGQANLLETRIQCAEEVTWPPAMLVNASLSLPFCQPRAFAKLWQKIEESLLVGGRFSGHFFGNRDDRALTHHSRQEVCQLLSGLNVEVLRENEREQATILNGTCHAHVFSVIARKAPPADHIPRNHT
jgi:SAM-dependent methyltransferase